MSCGIGGKTVEEAKTNMSYAEFLDWCKYREYWGPLHIGMRIDKAVARFLVHRFSSQKQKFKLHDFSPFDRMARDRRVLDSPDAFFEKLSEIAKVG